jgi:hypothetical protein
LYGWGASVKLASKRERAGGNRRWERRSEKKGELSPGRGREKKGKGCVGRQSHGERERERGCDVRGHREGKKRKRWRIMG